MLFWAADQNINDVWYSEQQDGLKWLTHLRKHSKVITVQNHCLNDGVNRELLLPVEYAGLKRPAANARKRHEYDRPPLHRDVFG